MVSATKYVALLAVSRGAREVCPKQIEMSYLFDASSSYINFLGRMSDLAPSLSESVNALFEDSKTLMRAVFWVDKPLPHHGVSQGRGYEYEDLDYCYLPYEVRSNASDFTNDIIDGHTWWLGAGGDFPENPYEALALASMDPRGFTDPSITVAEGRYIITRIAVIVTDDFGKLDGDAMQGVLDWNADPENPDRTVFYHPDFYTTGAGRFMDWFPINFDGVDYSSEEAYHKIVELKVKMDQVGLTSDEQAMWDVLYPFVGPDTFALPQPWEYDFDNMSKWESCGKYDYPSIAQIGRAVTEARVIPIVAVSPVPTIIGNHQVKLYRKYCDPEGSGTPPHDEYRDCVMKTFASHFREAGIEQFAVTSFDADDDETFKSAVLNAVEDITGGKWCGEDSIIVPPTEPVESTEEETEPVESTEEETEPVESTEEETEPVESTEEETEPVESTEEETEPVKSTEEETEPVESTEEETEPVESTEEETEPVESTEETEPVESTEEETEPVESTEEETETEVAVVPPGGSTSEEEEDDDSSIIPIVAGAVGGVVALGAAAYAAKIFGLFKRRDDSSLEEGADVEMMDVTIEREGVEDVEKHNFF